MQRRELQQRPSQKRLAFAAVIILLIVNAVPRMVVADKEYWFALSVPEPERFYSDMRLDNRWVTQVFGCPFVWYSEVGWEFRIKSGRELFLPGIQQLPARERFAFVPMMGDGVFVVCSGLLIFILTRQVASIIVSRKKRPI